MEIICNLIFHLKKIKFVQFNKKGVLKYERK